MIKIERISYKRLHHLVSYICSAPPQITFHMHQYYEVLFLKKGNATYVIEETEFPACEGDIFITKPNEIHSIVFTSDSEYERFFVQFDTDFLNFFSPTLKERFDIISSKHIINSETVNKHCLEQHFMKIYDCLSKKGLEYEAQVQGLLIELIIEICKCSNDIEATSFSTSKKTEIIKHFINENFTKNLSLDDIAESIFFNKYYMCHIFKEETGMTIKEYIELLRFVYAKKLHLEGKKITDIATLCGYSDYSLFYKNFIKLSGGKSPTEFFSGNTKKG